MFSSLNAAIATAQNNYNWVPHHQVLVLDVLDEDLLSQLKAQNLAVTGSSCEYKKIFIAERDYPLFVDRLNDLLLEESLPFKALL